MAVPGRGLTGGAGSPPPAAELLNALPAAVIVVDPEGVVRELNSATEAMLNMGASLILSRPLSDVLILPLDYVNRAEHGFALSLYDLPLMTTRGHRLRADFIVTSLADRPGWTVLTLHHGAAAHQMGHRLERSGGVRAATGAAGMLAHEIKNPLSGIRGAAQLIEAGVDGEAKALTTLIRTEVDRIAALIDQMEGFTDTRSLPPRAENIYPIIDHARQVAAQGFGAEVTFRERFDPSLPAALVHRDTMIQVLVNLMKNAAEATGPGGTILLTTAYRHGVSVNLGPKIGRQSLPIELCVIDDGPGAPAEMVDHLFDPFVSSKRDGRGLGLALVDKLVRDMGGIIQYSREGEPEQTVFRLLLPRARGS